MTSMTKLLPCPLCGSKAHRCEMESGYGTEFAICCNYKGCRLSEHPRFGHAYKTEAEAIAAWNSRAERTCKPTEEYCCQCGQDLVLCDMGIGPNGGAVELDPPILFNYCPNCGAKVIQGVDNAD